MAKPQRHRLLQGYPAVPLMQGAKHFSEERRRLDGALESPRIAEPPFIEIDRSRKLIVGVIPHAMCTPKRYGCGFCTFGQSPYRRSGMRLSMSELPRQIDSALAHEGHDFAGRKVEA